ncbi:MAG: hypothetical protein ACJ759_18500 [Thermoanaerobaculia bacterium]
MRQSKMYSGKVTAWDVLVTTLEDRLDEWSFLRPLYQELLSLVAESKAIVIQQEAARAQFHEAIGKRQNLEKRGAELRSRLAAHLKAQLGFRNEQLRQFGLNPVLRTRRQPVEEKVKGKRSAAQVQVVEETETEAD